LGFDGVRSDDQTLRPKHCNPDIATRTLQPEHCNLNIATLGFPEALTQRLDKNASSYTSLMGVNHTPTMPNLGDQP
jgi:hypothetical protein